jgi:FemAB-related protein (PEP-CTERM system-associated)
MMVGRISRVDEPEAPAARAAAEIDVALLAAGDAPAREWDTLVETHPGSSAYHLSFVRALVAEAFGHESFYFVARRGRGGPPAGLLPTILMRSALFGKYLVSLPFFNYGGALADGDDVREALVRAAASRCREAGARHLELRHVEPHEHLGLPARTAKVAMILELPRTAAELMKGLEGRVRNQIKQSQLAGLKVEEGQSDKLDDFFKVFVRNMRDLGTPAYPRRFFAAFLRHMGDRARIYVARHPNGRPAAAAVTITWRQKTEVPWASSVRDYNPLRPNNLLYWTMIERAIERGERAFDFGRSTEGGGTYRFKAGFGAKPLPFFWHYYMPRGGAALPGLHPDNPKFKLAIRMWQMLPVPITRILGPRIVRGLP